VTKRVAVLRNTFCARGRVRDATLSCCIILRQLLVANAITAAAHASRRWRPGRFLDTQCLLLSLRV